MYRMLIEPYKQTALRHLDMADTLSSRSFHDGAAFESIICAALLKRQPYNTPPLAHSTKLNRFLHVFAKDTRLVMEAARLSPYLLKMRNRVLYPELRPSAVIVPSAAVSARQVQNYLSKVKRFVNLVITKLGI
ncbi:TPA: hypothetical protein EYP66_24415 [Candidatus Poribacteria bacterium]|nr:hypothetical protein [Candidatus Poribacteria bacterium]